MKRLYSATFNSFRGIIDGVMTEAAVREEAVLLAVAVPLGFVLAPSPAWYVAMIGAVLLVLAVEFLNTAVEKLSDHVTPEHSQAIKIVKDLGSAAVFFAFLLAFGIWVGALWVRVF